MALLTTPGIPEAGTSLYNPGNLYYIISDYGADILMNKPSGKLDKDWYYPLPLALVVFLVPLIVYLKPVKLDGIGAMYWGADVQPDFFCYYKMVWLLLLVITGWILFIYVSYKQQLNIKKSKLYIPLGVYAVLVILSTILADYHDIALYGFPDRWEGMWVLLAYLSLAFLAINLINNEKHIRLVVGSLLCSAIVIGAIGLGQYLGHDFFNSPLGKSLILPASYEHFKDQMSIYFGAGTVYATLYNPNHVGSYMAMLFCFSSVLIMAIKKWQYRVLITAISLLMFAVLLGSNSRSSLIAAVLAILVFIVIAVKNRKLSWRTVLMLGGGIFIVLLVLNLLSNGAVVNRVVSIFSVKEPILVSDQVPGGIDNIIMTDKEVEFVTSQGNMSLYFAGGQLSFKEDGKPIEFRVDDKGNIIFINNKIEGFSFILQENRVKMMKGPYNLTFVLTPNGIYHVNDRGQQVVLKEAEKWGFSGNESFASGRGYIWSRSIPMLKETILVGHGPDSFEIYFPQDDYLGKIKAHMSFNQRIEKPHNQYLQMGINTGIISLLAFIALLIMYFGSSMKLYWNKPAGNTYVTVGLACFIALLAYAGAAVFNDSTVSVAPVFWVLLGLGISCNGLVKAEIDGVGASVNMKEKGRKEMKRSAKKA